jgi:hypothetical protein
MNSKKEQQLLSVINDTLWMAIRYADCRHTFAPSIVRDAVKTMKRLYPDFKLKPDVTIKPPGPDDVGGFRFRDDYLDDLFL